MHNKEENTGRYGIYSVFAYYPKTPEMINFKTKIPKGWALGRWLSG